MATAAFRSTTRRSSATSNNTPDTSSTGSSSSNRTPHHRRSRSLSRFSGGGSRFSDDSDELLPARRGRFVNTERGSGFPEILISLDDLANKFFPVSNDLEEEEEDCNDRGRRSARRSSSINSSSSAGTTVTSTAQRRARSVSRQPTNRDARSVSRQPTNRGGGDRKSLVENNSSGSNKSSVDNNNNSRRRRSVSVSRYHQFSDSESDHSIDSNRHASSKISRSANEQRSSVHNPTATNHQRVLRRSLSHRELSKPHDGYSSQSSALTDDESRDVCSNKHENERTIRAVYSQKMTEHPTGDGVDTGLYEAMRNEVRYAVDKIRTELEQVIVKTKSSDVTDADCLHSKNADALQAVSLIRKNYSRLEQSEKRKQDLLAEIVVEEQRGRELSKIVKDLLPDPKSTAVPEKPLRTRKRSNDRNRMSKCLTEEAEKYFEDFISNVEDTDISSLDGERSDASSKLGGIVKSRDTMMHFEETEKFETPTKVTSLPVEMDGVVLPWLDWETSTDGSPLLCKNTAEMAATPNNSLRDTAQEMGTAYSQSNCFNSSHGSWSPIGDSASVISRDTMTSKDREPGNHLSKLFAKEPREPWFDMDEYFQLQQNENMLFENWTQRQRINSGGLLLCSRSFL